MTNNHTSNNFCSKTTNNNNINHTLTSLKSIDTNFGDSNPYNLPKNATEDLLDNDNDLNNEADYKKLVIVGDGNVGKTSLLLKYVDNVFTQEYTPTIFQSHTAMVPLYTKRPKSIFYTLNNTNVKNTVKDLGIEYDKHYVKLSLWDTAGQEDYDRIRPLSYLNTKVVVLSFAVNNRSSYDNVLLKWHPEISHFCPCVPYILVGLKCDLRLNNDKADGTVSYEEGVKLCKKINAKAYFECSAKTGYNIREVIINAAEIAYKHNRSISTRNKRLFSRKCLLL